MTQKYSNPLDLFGVWTLVVIISPSGGCFTSVSRALQNNLAKIYNASYHIYGENFKLKLCTCAQSMALGTRTKFQLEMLMGSAISAIHKVRENILESSRNVSETTPRTHADLHWRGINNYNYGAWPVQKTIRPQIIMMANSNSIYFCIQFAFNNRLYVIYISKTWLYFNNAFELNFMLMSTGRIGIYIKPHNSCHHIITGEWHHADHQYMGSLCTTSDMWKVR